MGNYTIRDMRTDDIRSVIYTLTKVNNQKIQALLARLGFTRGEAFYWLDKQL